MNIGAVVAVVNQKGGVGKTTTAVNVAACMGELGLNVILVDIDPQGNATSGFGLQPGDSGGVYELLTADSKVDPYLVSRETSVQGVRVIPTSADLAGAEVELANGSRDEVRRCLEPLRTQFEVIVLDTPPSLGILTVNCLVAATHLIVPVQCEYYALEGLKHLNRTVAMIQSALNPDLRILGLVPTMYARTLLSQQVALELQNHFGELAFRTVIPRTVRLSEAPSHGQPIIAYDPRSLGARAYRELTLEVLVRLGISPKLATPVVSRTRSMLNSITGVFAGRVKRDPATSPEQASIGNEEAQNTQSNAVTTPGDETWSNEASVEDYLL